MMVRMNPLTRRSNDKVHVTIWSFLRSEDFLPLIIISIVNAYLVLRPILDGGYLLNSDHPCRFAESMYLADELLSKQFNPFGWNPYLQTGLPMFRFGPTFLPMFAVALVRLVLPFASAATSYNLVYVFIYVLIPVSAFLFAKGIGLGIFGRILFCSLISFTFVPFPGVVFSTLPNASLIVGVWPYTVGVMFAFLANRVFWRFIKDPDVKGFVGFSTLGALAGLSNVLAAFGMGFMSLSIILTDLLKRKNLKRSIWLTVLLFLAAILAVSLAGFYLLPTYYYHDYYYDLNFYGSDQETAQMVFLSPFVMPWLEYFAGKPGGWFLPSIYPQSYLSTWILGIVGLAVALRSRREDGLFFVFLLTLSLFGASGVLSSIITQNLRFLDFARISLLGLAALAVDSIYARYVANQKNLARLIAIALVLFSLLPQLGDSMHYFALAQSMNSRGPTEDVEKVMTWLRDDSQQTGAIWIEDTSVWDNPVEPMNGLWYSHAFGAAFYEIGGRRIYGGFYRFWYKPFLTSWTELNYNIYAEGPAEAYDVFLKYNVHYVVVFSSFMKAKLEVATLFNDVYESGDFMVLEVLGFKDELAFSSLGSKTDIMEFRPNFLSIKVEDAKPGEKLIVKMGYMPNWRAFVGNTELMIEPQPPAFSSISLPAGSNEIRLIFGPTPFEIFSWISSLLTWILAFFLYCFFGHKKLGFIEST